MNNFQQKLKKLPPDVSDCLVSEKSSEYNSLLIKKFQLNDMQREKFLDIVEGIYFKEIPLAGLSERIAKDIGLDSDKSRNFACDLIGIKLLCAKDWFGPDLEMAMNSLGMDKSLYQSYVDDYNKAIIEERKDYENQIRKDDTYEFIEKNDTKQEYKPLNVAIEKQQSLTIFKERLYNFLDNENDVLTSAYNLHLISMIAEDSQFKRNLELALYENAEILTSQSFVSGNRLMAPTIGNWLKEFIAVNGSDYFDNVLLSRFVANSNNVKVLPGKEREIVKRLLRLYRNLKYFPKGQNYENVEDWEIIPVKRNTANIAKIEHLSVPKSFEEKKADELASLKDLSVTELEKRVLDEELGKNKEVQKLMLMARKYPENSMQRKAIEAEIERIKK